MVHRPSTVFPLLLWILDVSVANFTPFYFLKPRYYVVVLQRFGQNDSTKSHFHVISRKITHKFFNYELATLQIAPYFPPKVKSWDLSYLHSRGCNCAKEQRQYRKSFTIRLWKSVLVIGRSASVSPSSITCITVLLGELLAPK